jgi:hypothetical protein
MFTFNFSWLHWDIIINLDSILMKLTVSGPFVTLYSKNDYLFIVESKNYGIIHPFLREHSFAHGENILYNFYPSSLQGTHTHVILPCKKSIVTELRELLEFIARHNTQSKKLIDSDLIEKCIEAYQDYLSTSSLDENKKNANCLLMRWIGPYFREIDPIFNPDIREIDPVTDPLGHENKFLEKSLSNDIEIPDVEKVVLAIIKYLDSPNQNSFEQLRNEAFNFFALLNNFPHLKKDQIRTLIGLMPESSTYLFNQFVSRLPTYANGIAYGSLLASFISISKICELFSHDLSVLVVGGLFLGLFLYAPYLAEKGYSLFLQLINAPDKTNIKYAEIMTKNKNLSVFSNVKEVDSKKINQQSIDLSSPCPSVK